MKIRKKIGVSGIVLFAIFAGIVLYPYFFSVNLFSADLLSPDFFSSDRDSQPTAAATVIQDQGSITITFCPKENCSEALAQFLASAEQSIHCAAFELDLPGVQQVLLQKASEIDVRVVMDDQYIYEFNHSFVKADRWGLMHNKFCIVDGQKISTGSMNPTVNDAQKNNNNLLLIDSSLVAQQYEEEFQELWQGIFKKGEKNENPPLLLGDTIIEIYFCPDDGCAEKVMRELEKAQQNIRFMTFSFTHQGIANMLLLKHLDNISISGVMEARQISKYSVYEQLKYQGIDVLKDGNPRNMHHKVFIIDSQTIITGSFNPTDGGDTRNDENLLIIKNPDLAQEFLEEFEKVYGEAVKAQEVKRLS